MNIVLILAIVGAAVTALSVGFAASITGGVVGANIGSGSDTSIISPWTSVFVGWGSGPPGTIGVGVCLTEGTWATTAAPSTMHLVVCEVTSGGMLIGSGEATVTSPPADPLTGLIPPGTISFVTVTLTDPVTGLPTTVSAAAITDVTITVTEV